MILQGKILILPDGDSIGFSNSRKMLGQTLESLCHNFQVLKSCKFLKSKT